MLQISNLNSQVFILIHETSLTVTVNWGDSTDKVKVFVSSALKKGGGQPPSYSFVIFSKDKPPVTITEVLLCFLIHWLPMTAHRPHYSLLKPQNSWLKGITLICILFLHKFNLVLKVQLLSMTIKWNHLYSQVYLAQFFLKSVFWIRNKD